MVPDGFHIGPPGRQPQVQRGIPPGHKTILALAVHRDRRLLNTKKPAHLFRIPVGGVGGFKGLAKHQFGWIIQGGVFLAHHIGSGLGPGNHLEEFARLDYRLSGSLLFFVKGISFLANIKSTSKSTGVSIKFVLSIKPILF